MSVDCASDGELFSSWDPEMLESLEKLWRMDGN